MPRSRLGALLEGSFGAGQGGVPHMAIEGPQRRHQHVRVALEVLPNAVRVQCSEAGIDDAVGAVALVALLGEVLEVDEHPSVVEFAESDDHHEVEDGLAVLVLEGDRHRLTEVRNNSVDLVGPLQEEVFEVGDRGVRSVVPCLGLDLLGGRVTDRNGQRITRGTCLAHDAILIVVFEGRASLEQCELEAYWVYIIP